MKKNKLVIILSVIIFLFTACSNHAEDRESKKETSPQLIIDSETGQELKESATSDQLSKMPEEYDDFLMYLAYYNKLSELQGRFGNTSAIVQTYESRLIGLCYADLIDFNADGHEELLTVYCSGKKAEYVLEIWEYRDSACQKIFEDSSPFGDYYSQYYSVMIEDSDVMPYYVQISDQGEGYNYWGYQNDKFVIKKSHVLCDGKFLIDGEEVSENDYYAYLNNTQWEINELCYLMSDVTDSYGFLDDTVSGLQKTFTALCKNIGLSEDEVVVSLEPSKFKTLSNDEVSELARLYYEESCGYKPSIADIEGIEKAEDGEWATIHLYDIMDAHTDMEHTATSDWYHVNLETGVGINELNEEVDLKKVYEYWNWATWKRPIIPQVAEKAEKEVYKVDNIVNKMDVNVSENGIFGVWDSEDGKQRISFEKPGADFAITKDGALIPDGKIKIENKVSFVEKWGYFTFSGEGSIKAYIDLNEYDASYSINGDSMSLDGRSYHKLSDLVQGNIRGITGIWRNGDASAYFQTNMNAMLSGEELHYQGAFTYMVEDEHTLILDHVIGGKYELEYQINSTELILDGQVFYRDGADISYTGIQNTKNAICDTWWNEKYQAQYIFYPDGTYERCSITDTQYTTIITVKEKGTYEVIDSVNIYLHVSPDFDPSVIMYHSDCDGLEISGSDYYYRYTDE